MTMPFFFSERQRAQEVAQREAEGISLWTTEFSDVARNRLVHAWRSSVNTDDRYSCQAFAGRPAVWDVAKFVLDVVLKDLGWMVFRKAGMGSDNQKLEQAFHREGDDVIPNLIEGVSLIFASADDARESVGLADKWERQVNAAFRRERVGYALVEGHVVQVESQELHAEVVAPVVRLLSGRDGWDAVESAYQDALNEDDPADAIVDASTALQDALRVRGCTGEQIGPLVKSALKTRVPSKNGVLAPHDSPLADAVEKTIKWVGAERGQRGGTHKESVASPEDVWLTIHIVGALILRLATGDDRGAPA